MLVAVALAEGIERVEIAAEDVLTFPRGIVGFEDVTRFALFRLEGPLYLLQAVDDPSVSFALADPQTLAPHFQPVLAVEDRAILELGDSEQPVLMCIVSLSPEGVPCTVNLRGPVAINVEKRVGTQFILQDSAFQVREPVAVSADGRLVLSASAAGRGAAASSSRLAGESRSRASGC